MMRRDGLIWLVIFAAVAVACGASGSCGSASGPAATTTSSPTPSKTPSGVATTLATATQTATVTSTSAASTLTPSGSGSSSGQGAGTITSVVFTGGPKAPIISVNGTGLGSMPAANPSYTPGGHPPLCPQPIAGEQGYDYGLNFYIADTQRNWSAGRYRPDFELDCIGVIPSRFTATQVVFTLGSFYASSGQFQLSEGDAFEISVNGTIYRGVVAYK